MIEAALAALFGLIIGSFLNVCIYRLPRDLSVVTPRSHCPHCEQTIAWYDNVPVLSFLVLRARCRYCSARIPVRYPLVELMTGGLFFLAVYWHGLSLPALKLCVFAAIMVELTFSDLETRILPDEFTLGGTLAGIVLAVFTPMDGGIISAVFSFLLGPVALSVAESIAGVLLTSGVLFFVGWAYHKLRKREGLGLGDVKMIAAIGAFLGIHQTLLTLIIGSLAGSIIGLVYIYGMKKDPTTYELPYGTFLGAAAIFFAFFSSM